MKNQSFPFQSNTKKAAVRQDRKNKGFVPPRLVEDHWNLYRKGLYIAKPGRGWPGWLLPLVAFVLIVALVFWAAPTVINRVQSWLNAGQDQNQNEIKLIYDQDTWTVRRPVADVFDRDDLKAGRVTQTLFNEPVRILPQDCTYGFVKVILTDGTQGYMFASDLVDSRDSIEPGKFTYKLVIAATSKRIMSHASRGTLLAEVMMGTILYADYRGDGISRVWLPGGGQGWISDDGVMILQPQGKIEPLADGVRYFCSTALAFNQVTVLENGQSILGISPAGITRLAGAVNGFNLPRSVEALSQSGRAVTLIKDEETNLYNLEQIEAGDLIFLSDTAKQSDPAEPSDLAICIESTQILYAKPGQSAISLIDLNQNQDIWKRILFVRRLY